MAPPHAGLLLLAAPAAGHLMAASSPGMMTLHDRATGSDIKVSTHPDRFEFVQRDEWKSEHSYYYYCHWYGGVTAR